MSARIVVLDYGMGNIHSILKALRLYHSNVEFSADPDVISQADALVLPGDGAFGAAMDGLAGGRREALLAAVQAGKPLLGICIGFQILFQDSNESGIHKGLGLLEGQIRRFEFEDSSIRVPHMGWNKLEYQTSQTLENWPKDGSGDQHVYFIHSYRAENVPENLVVARANYAGDLFPAFVHSENIMAMQFHPEKSDKYGLAMIEHWVQQL